MMLVMSSRADSGMQRWIMKALVDAESVEWTPVRYKLFIRFDEWSAEIRRSVRDSGGLVVKKNDGCRGSHCPVLPAVRLLGRHVGRAL